MIGKKGKRKIGAEKKKEELNVERRGIKGKQIKRVGTGNEY